MIRIQMMLVGMGAGLLLARPACAQQEMDPELFDVYANTTVTDQASHATPGAEAVKVAAPAPLAAEGVDAEGLTAVDTSAMVILMIGIGSDRKSTRLNSSHANISYAVF